VTLSPGAALPNGQFLPRITAPPRTNEYLTTGSAYPAREPGHSYYLIIDGMAEFLNVNAASMAAQWRHRDGDQNPEAMELHGSPLVLPQCSAQCANLFAQRSDSGGTSMA
jgi:hypothetical protein